VCAKCGLPDHDSSMCRTEKSRYKVNKYEKFSKPAKNKYSRQVEEESDPVLSEDSHEEKEYSFHVVHRVIYAKLITVNVGGVEIHMLIDSGSMCNVIPVKLWKK
jgi:hypothetical protein